MDFFAREAAARRRSRAFTFLFFVAAASTITSVGLLAWGGWSLGQRYPVGVFLRGSAPPDPFPVIIGATLLTAMIITVAVMHQALVLSRGGAALAELVGGRPVPPDAPDPQRRQLLNVVEEMAIAAGLPVPTVYLLEREDGINAFAAGFSADDAVLALTAGAVKRLTRDELQAVVAHELSHVLNGDMALNVQLTIQLQGLIVLSQIGRTLTAAGFGTVQSMIDDDDAGGGRRRFAGSLIAGVLGLGFLAVGSVGAFFGALFRAAVSRQRELLADAAAVQFTRNPGAVAGALEKILALGDGARLRSVARAQVSHFLFVEEDDWFSSHPPLVDRILAIEPAFDGTLPDVEPAAAAPPPLPRPPAAPAPAAVPAGPTAAHLERAALVTAALPPPLAAAVRDPLAARAVIAALLLQDDPEVRDLQMDALVSSSGDPAFVDLVRQLAPLARSCPPEAWLPLAQLSYPALRRLSEPQYRGWRRTILRLVEAAPEITLFEYALQRSLLRRLEPAFSGAPAPRPAAGAATPPPEACAVLLSALAQAGRPRHDGAAAAFAAGAAALAGAGISVAPQSPADCALPQIDDALDRLDGVSAAGKRLLVEACAAVVIRDRTVTIDELELLRAISDGLGCPMPPLAADPPLRLATSGA